MPRIGNPFEAMARLDDRFLGRWLYRPRRPMPLWAAIVLTVLVVAVALAFAVFTGNVALLIAPILALLTGWWRRGRNPSGVR